MNGNVKKQWALKNKSRTGKGIGMLEVGWVAVLKMVGRAQWRGDISTEA